jgi:hypothetical protein
VQREIPDIIRSAPDIRAQERTAVRFRSASTLTGLTWSDRLAPVPGGVTFTKQPLKGKKTGGSRDSIGGVNRGHEGRFGENEREVRLPATSLELLGVPMWVSEFLWDRRMGRNNERSLSLRLRRLVQVRHSA